MAENQEGGNGGSPAEGTLKIYVLDSNTQWQLIYSEHINAYSNSAWSIFERDISIPADINMPVTGNWEFAALLIDPSPNMEIQWFDQVNGSDYGMKWYKPSTVETPQSMLPAEGTYFTFFVINQANLQ